VGTTVLLTTQYLEEADHLAQRIAVVDHGRITAQGTAAQLKGTIGTMVLAVRLADPGDAENAGALLADPAATDAPLIDTSAGEIRLAVSDPGVSAEAVRRLDTRQMRIAAIELQQPSLDDVFLRLTGRPAHHDADQPTRENA